MVLRDDLWLASMVAGAWLIHPVCVGAVCSIVQQAELLMALFFTSYLLVVVTIPRRSIWFSASLVYVCLFGGLSSKVVMVAAIPAGILLDATVSRASIGAVLKTRWQVHLVPSMAALLVAIMLLPMLLRAEGGIGFGGDAPPVFVYLASSLKALSTYVAISIFPWELSIDRGPSFTHRLRDASLELAGMLLYVVSAAVLWRRQPLKGDFSRYLAWLMLMPLIILAPTTSFIPTADPVFEHRIYLPLAFCVWLVVIVVQILIDRYVAMHYYGKAVLRFSLGIVAILLATRTIARANDYASAERLWKTALMVDPDNARAAQNFVATLQHSGRDAVVRPELTALILEADSRGRKIDVLAHQLAKDHMRRGEFPKAYQMLATLADRSPPIHELLTDRQRREIGERWFDLALVQSQLGRSREALQSVERVLQCSPKDPFAFAFAGDLSFTQGDTDQAIAYWGKAIKYGGDLLPEVKEKLEALQEQTASTTPPPRS